MQWNDVLLMTGVCAVVCGGIASILYRSRGWRLRQPTTHLTITSRLESLRELGAVALFWAGMVLTEMGTIANQIERGASSQRLAFSLAAAAVSLLVCGGALGRLSLRLQLQLTSATARLINGSNVGSST